MPLDPTEIADLLIDDWEEDVTSGATTFKAAFVMGGSKLGDETPGEEILDRASLIYKTAAVTLVEQDLVTRASDSSNWRVVLVHPAQAGLIVAELQTMRRATLGKM